MGEIVVKEHEKYTTVRLIGSFSFDVEGEMKHRLNEIVEQSKNKKFVIDLFETQFLVTLTYNALINLYNNVVQNDGKMVFRNPNQHIMNTIKIMKLETIIPITFSIADSKTALEVE